jgi:methyl-accepting chemotaxis protein
MKTNLPVTNIERPFPDGKTITSKTDAKGIITYVNAAFVEISGFTEQELIGANHNIVRHPDMPPAAFEDLWDTIKAGKPWSGVVKNRCKNGDHYWVKANVTPISEESRLSGYLSVRHAVTRKEIEQAEGFYRTINEGKASFKSHSRLARFNVFRRLSLKVRMYAASGFVLLLLAVMGAIGLYGVERGAEAMRITYQQQFAPTTVLADIMQKIMDNRLLVMEAAGAGTKEVIQRNIPKVIENRDQISSLWDEFMMNNLGPEEEQLASEWAEKRSAFIRDGLGPAVSALGAGKIEEARRHIFGGEANRLYSEMATSEHMLVAYKLEQAKQSDADAVSRHHLFRIVLVIVFVVVAVISLSASYGLMLSIQRPLALVRAVFARLAQGKYDNEVDIKVDDELGEVLYALKSMQIILGFNLNDSKQLENEATRIKIALDNASTNVMFADNTGRIMYLNKAVVDMLKAASEDIRKDFASFDPDKLMGMNIDTFHKNPSHQRELLSSLTTTHRATIQIGSRSFNLAANPVVNDKGERLGTCVEWMDITAELAVQEEITALVNAAAAGDLTKRVALEDKQGFMKKLGEGMNELLEVLASAMDDVATSLDAMAKGDLTVSITKDYEGTFGKLKDDINATLAMLTEVVGSIKESADFIKTASSEISMGNTNLSQRTQEQASALEETASSMEQMTSTVKQNADNAKQANQMVNSARDLAQSSGEIVTNAVGAMDAIATSSKKISDIIGVIDEIAFQTNLLALNAAVEAARAGEQGRGFAVVATEVRNLAQRSATAAKEIKGLINDSVESVENGNKQVDATGEVLSEISGSVKKISDIVAEIAAVSHEQASGIEQVNKAVMQMDEMTQQNAALVEEAAAASKSMEEQAVQLAEQVTFFKLNESAKADQNLQRKTTKVSAVPPPAKSAAQPPKKMAPVLKTVASRPSSAKIKGGKNDEWDEF